MSDSTLSEEILLRNVYDDSPAGIEIYDAQGKLTDANTRCLEIFGVENVDDIKGFDLFSDPNFPEEQKRQLKNGKTVEYDSIFDFGLVIKGALYKTSKNGTLHISVRISPVKSTASTIIGYIVHVYDMTQRIQNETLLKEKDEKYRSLIKLMENGFALHEIICDEKGKPCDYRFLEVNTGFEKMTGLDADGIIGKTVLEVLPKTEPYWIEIYGKVALFGEAIRFERYSQEFDKYYEVLAFSPKKDQFATVFTDNTERVLAEKSLRLTQFSVENMSEAAFWMGPDAKFIYVNEAACKALSYSREELLKMTVHDIDPDFPAEVWPAHWKDVKKRKSFIINSHHRTKQGYVFPVEVCINYVEFDGMEYNCAFARDMSEWIKTEEKLKELVHEKEVLIREVHHRVKNNFTVISSLINLQSSRIKDKKSRQLLEESKSRIQSMALIHDKLYRSGDLSSVNFSDYINSIVSMLADVFLADSNSVTILPRLADLSLKVDYAIPCGLIVNELVTNAMKYAFPRKFKEQATIRITLREKESKQIELIVSDNGVGIPDDIDLKTTDSLGLHLVQLLAEEQLGGSVKLNRKKGTKFTVRFTIQ